MVTPMTRPDRIPVPAEFAALPFGEQLILWAIRFWVKALQTEANAQTVLRAGFECARAPDAHPALDDLMTIISISAQRSIDIRCPKCPSISPDEERLLGAVAAWQHGLPPAYADSFFSAWLPASALRVARTPASQLAYALSHAGMMIRSRKPGRPETVRNQPEDIEEGRTVTVH
tara:strand:+ start:492 stop:1013 length:522 start_codon:yes stop_codon:yes gene_type:complete